MKVKIYNYQTENDKRADLLITELDLIPIIGHGIEFYFKDEIYWARVEQIDYCFNSEHKFSHIDIKISHF